MLSSIEKIAALKEASEIYQRSDPAHVNRIIEREMVRQQGLTSNHHKQAMTPAGRRTAKTREDITAIKMRQELLAIDKAHSL